MKPKTFFKYVELPTKVASVIPFILGALFALSRYAAFRIEFLVVFFISMITLDMATTALNNYMDYKRAIKKEGYNYEEHNAIVRFGIEEKRAVRVILVLLTMSVLAGLILFIMTDWVILGIGVISFLVGIAYSYGPLPLSRTPLGELFSGIMMGGLIFFVTVYMQVFDAGFVLFSYQASVITLQVNAEEIFIMVWTAMPLIFMIANIMLANNICDLEDDIDNKRYTLPYFIGKTQAIYVYAGLYLTTYVAIVLGVLLGFLPIINLLVLLTVVPVSHHVRLFSQKQDKATTFIYAVKNFVLISGVWILTFAIHLIYPTFLGN